jgi:hypothetical protein
MKRAIVAVASCLLLAGTVVAERPVNNVNANRHPNLAAAQRLCQEAYDKVTAAQQANEWDMSGHAKKAKELLEQASREIKLAAEAANQAK